MKAFWLVWNPKTGHAAFRQSSFAAAKAHAKQLACLHPETEFVVLRAEGRAKKVDVAWEEFEDDLGPCCKDSDSKACCEVPC